MPDVSKKSANRVSSRPRKPMLGRSNGADLIAVEPIQDVQLAE
jgi:hypothetical protein